MLLQAIQDQNLPNVIQAIKNGENVNYKSTESSITPLILACDLGNLEIVKLLLNAGANPNLPGEQNNTPLMVAANPIVQSGDALEICTVLIEWGAEISSTNDSNETVIEMILYSPDDEINTDILNLLLSVYAKQESSENLSKIAFLVINYGPLSALETLYDLGLNIESFNNYGYSLLAEACRIHQVEKAACLIKWGADFGSYPKTGWADHIFAIACRFGRVDIIETLKARGFRFDANPELLQMAINSAIETNSGDLLQYLESNGINLAQFNPGLLAGLMVAIQFNHFELFSHLLNQTKDLEIADQHGNTPLLYAAYFGRLKMATELLSKGANKYAKNNLGWNALMQAAAAVQIEMIAFLLKLDLDLNATDEETGATSLYISASDGKLDIVKILTEAGANPTIHAKNGKIAATVAKAEGHLNIVSFLGNSLPHFNPHAQTDDKIICAYCAEPLSDESASHNFCTECNYYYCENHYPWSSWHLMDPTAVYPSRFASCPNGHVKWENWDVG